MVGTHDPEYEDLVQSSMLSIVATLSAGKFRGECPGDGWAAVIARNVAVNAIRARVRERRIFTADAAGETQTSALEVKDPALGPERLTELHRKMAHVQSAMAAVGSDKACVVYLHDLLGYRLAEVAELLGTSLAAAQSRLVRGRREIAERIGADL
jgi:RNA polymerase sigma-70 factor (ECF subfamily)